ncbi:MAG: glycosyl transferase family 90 [Pseudomonadota bacterium]
MPSFQKIEFDHTVDGVAGLLRQISFTIRDDSAISVTNTNLPISCVRVTFTADGGISVGVPFDHRWTEELSNMTQRWLQAWPIFLTARRRHPDAEGHTLFCVNDIPDQPGIAFSGNSPGNVLIPDADFIRSQGYATLRRFARTAGRPWRDRDDVVFWRGSSTGIPRTSEGEAVSNIPRVRLCRLVRDWKRPDLFNIGITQMVQVDEAAKALAESYGVMAKSVPQQAFAHYRHTLDIDGNTSSWAGLFGKLILGNTILKIDSATGHRQWYYDRLVPFKNFVPVRADLSNLLPAAEWLRHNPAAAEAIAARGAELADAMSFEAEMALGADRIRAALRED